MSERLILRRITVAYLWLMSLQFWQQAWADDVKPPFMEVVRTQFHSAKGIQLSLNNLISQYVPIGTTKAEMTRFCESNGLKLGPYLSKKKPGEVYDETIACSARVKLFRNSKGEPIGFGEEVNLYFKLAAGKVVYISGIVFSLHL